MDENRRKDEKGGCSSTDLIFRILIMNPETVFLRSL